MVTIFTEDHVISPTGVSKVFDAAGLRKFWFPVSQMPQNGGDWPTVDPMVQKSRRLFSEKKLENLNRIERISLIEKELQEME